MRPAPQVDPDTVEAVFEVPDQGDGRREPVRVRVLADLLERELDLLVLTVGLVVPEDAETVRHGGREEVADPLAHLGRRGVAAHLRVGHVDALGEEQLDGLGGVGDAVRERDGLGSGFGGAHFRYHPFGMAVGKRHVQRYACTHLAR